MGVVLAGCCSMPVFAGLDEGAAAWNCGDYSTAQSEFRLLSELELELRLTQIFKPYRN